MNGNKFLIDTNILLYLIGGKISIQDLPDGRFYISFVTELEVLSYSSISSTEEKRLRKLLSEMPIININKEIKKRTIEFRRKYKLRLPDAIIAGTAFVLGASLITNDRGFSIIHEIQIESLNL